MTSPPISTTRYAVDPGRHKNARRIRRRPRLWLESLEPRNCLSSFLEPSAGVAETQPNDTLDVAQDVGTVDHSGFATVAGKIGETLEPSADVDWYQFSLEQPAEVQLGAAGLPVALTLYSSRIDEFDPLAPLGHRLLAHGDAGRSARPAAHHALSQDGEGITTRLGQGTYYVAVSGSGNRYFHPFLADSGISAPAGDYVVSIAAAPLDADPGAEAGNGGHDAPRFQPYETTAGDDTPSTATGLGDLTSVGLTQAAGAIGDDPFYDPNSEDPQALNPAADVDLYHFQINGPGRYSLVAEAFAGRIGSPLDPALTLFSPNAAGELEMVATNGNTLNPSVAANDTSPLYTDAVLSVGLTEGDYYLAVSGAGNDPEWGPDGVFLPGVPHSGLNGYSTGDYVLTLLVSADNEAPQVQSVSIQDGATLTESPRRFEVAFNEPVNLQQLAYRAFQQVSDSTVSAVYVQNAEGARFFPRLESYDPATDQARFLMLDHLASGAYELHLSGAAGLNDLADNPLVGNDSSGDFVVRFTVEGRSPGRSDEPSPWPIQEPNNTLAEAQDLGVLFPHELQATVALVRSPSAGSDQAAADDADYFRFELLQSQTYFFTLVAAEETGVAAPQMALFDGDGRSIDAVQQGTGSGLQAALRPGVYVLHIGDWSLDQSDEIAYQLEIELGGLSENPAPLTSAAAPAVGIHLYGGGWAAGDEFATRVVTVQAQPDPSAERAAPAAALVSEPSTAKPADWVFGSYAFALGASLRTPPAFGASHTVNESALAPVRAGLLSSDLQPADETLLAVARPVGLFRGLNAAPLGSKAGSRTDLGAELNDGPLVRLHSFAEPDTLLVRRDASGIRTQHRSAKGDSQNSLELWAGKDRTRPRTRADDSDEEGIGATEAGENVREVSRPNSRTTVKPPEAANASEDDDRAPSDPETAGHPNGSDAPAKRVRPTAPSPTRSTLR